MRGVGGKAERRGEDEQEQEGRGGGEKKKREEENKAEEKKDEKDGGTADQEGREGCGAGPMDAGLQLIPTEEEAASEC